MSPEVPATAQPAPARMKGSSPLELSRDEAWHARLREARRLWDIGDEGGFINAALTLFGQRPDRAEPLYDLARFYRERGLNELGVLFAEAGLAVPPPRRGMPFVEDFVYAAGLEEEYSIAAFYSGDPATKDRGFAACNFLALSREASEAQRALARSNLRFYAEPVALMMPSFAARSVQFTPPEGWHPANPSLACREGRIMMIVRAVNYEISSGGHYCPPDGEPIRTRNFLLRLDPRLDVEWSSEILPPSDLPAPAFAGVRGFEDARLFVWRDALWFVATLRELTRYGWCQQVLARIGEGDGASCRVVDWRVLVPEGPRRHEKNWMPFVDDDELRLVYLCDPTRVLDGAARTVVSTSPSIAAETFRGGSQAIPFDGGWLALIHEVQAPGGYSPPTYCHRFVWLDAAWMLRGVSRPFFFRQKGIEFAAGLAWHPTAKRLLISYGVGDREAWLAEVDPADVRLLLLDAARLPSAATFLRDADGEDDGTISASDPLPAEFDDRELAQRSPSA